MPRPQINSSSTNPLHLCARSNNRDWFSIPMPEVWDIMGRYLFLMHHAYGARIYGFVLMANHFHLIASFPKEDRWRAMQYFMRETSRCIARAGHRINHVYGGRYFRSEILRLHHFTNVYKYVYRNPVEAAACASVEEYPWSTLHGLLGLGHLMVPVEADTILFDDVERTVAWLNRQPSAAARDAMRFGLRRGQFRLPKLRAKNDENPLEYDLY